jgi:hypothetical protein
VSLDVPPSSPLTTPVTKLTSALSNAITFALGVSVLDGCDREPVELRALGEDPVEGARHLERVRSRVANGESPFRGSEPGGEVDEIMGLELELAGQSRVALLGAFVMRSDLDVRPIRAGADPLQLVRRRERES